MSFRDNEEDESKIQNSKQERIKALLVRIGERSSSPLEKNLKMLSKALSRDLPEETDFILDILFQSVVYLTSKTGVYGTLAGLLNQSDPSFGKSVIERLARDFELSLSSSDFPRIKILIRFFVEICKSKIISEQDLFRFLNDLLNTFVLDEKATNNSVKDFFFYSVFSTIPYGGSHFLKNAPDSLAELLRKLSNYFSKREKDSSEKFNSAFRSFKSKKLDSEESALKKFYKAVMEGSKREWKCNGVLNPCINFNEEFSSNETFAIPKISFENFLNKEKIPPRICPLLQIMEQNENDFDNKYILFEYYSEIIINFEDYIEEGVRQLAFIAERTETNSLLVESIFSLMFELPRTRNNFVSYGCYLNELISLKPKIFPKLVGKCVGLLFDRLEDIDFEVRERFSEWFALHLNHYQFKWAWSSWSFVTTLHPEDPKRTFCENVLRRCGELVSNPLNFENEQLSELVPKDTGPTFALIDFLTAETEKEKELENDNNKEESQIKNEIDKDENKDKNNAMVDDEEGESGKSNLPNECKNLPEDKKFALEIFRMFNGKEEPEKVIEALRIAEQALNKNMALDVFFGCMLFSGSASPSSLFRLFDRYKPIIIERNLSENEKKRLVKITMQFWKESYVMQRVILQKLVTYGFVPLKTLFEEILSEENLSSLYKPVLPSVLTGLLDLFAQREKILKNLLRKDFSDEKEEKTKNDLVEKISMVAKEREEALMTVLSRLLSALNYSQNKMENFYENTTFQSVFARFVQFLRRYSEIGKKLKEKLLKQIKEEFGAEIKGGSVTVEAIEILLQ